MVVRNNKFAGLLLICLFTINVNAQTINTPNVLSVQTVMEWVRTNHPIAKQANLLTERADAELTATRGAFDPTFNNCPRLHPLPSKPGWKIIVGCMPIPKPAVENRATWA